MKVTDLTISRTNHSFFSVYLDNDFFCDLSIESIEKLKVKVGKEISSSTASDLRRQAKIDEYFLKCLRQISIRKRSQSEIKNFLLKNQLNELESDEVIETLKSKNYINDLEYAKSFVHDRMLLNPTSYKKLEFLLRSKGLDKEILEQVISRDEVDRAAIEKIITKKRKLSRFKDDKKLINYLITQGFSYSSIKEYLEDQVH